jgi:hypothetical protein
VNRQELTELREAAEAYPFVEDNWQGSYTRDTKIKSIRREGERYWPLWRNLKSAFSDLTTIGRSNWEKDLFGRKPQPLMAWYAFRHVNDNLPDGALNDGCIITYWEETGQFIENFPPSVVKELIELAELGMGVAEERLLKAVEKSRVSSLSETEREALRKDTDAPLAKYTPGPEGKPRLT